MVTLRMLQSHSPSRRLTASTNHVKLAEVSDMRASIVGIDPEFNPAGG